MAEPALNVPAIEVRHRMRVAMEHAGLKPADMARDGPWPATDGKGRAVEVALTIPPQRSAIAYTVRAQRVSGISKAPVSAVPEHVRLDGDRLHLHSYEFMFDVQADADRLRASIARLVEAAPLGQTSSQLPSAFTTPLGGQRFQYAVVNTGSFGTGDRLADVLAEAGAAGWELVTIYDKSSNWFAGMEKGFMLLKRPIPDGTDVDEFCITFRG